MQGLSGYLGATGGVGGEEGFGDLVRMAVSSRMNLGEVTGLGGITRLTGMTGTAGLATGLAGRQGIQQGTQLFTELVAQLPAAFYKATQTYFSADKIAKQGVFLASLPEIMFGAGKVDETFMKTGGGREQVESMFRSMTTPKNRAHEAFMMTALMQGGGKGQSMFDLQLRMREGLTPGNARDVFALLQKVPKNLRGYYALAMTEGSGASSDLIRSMVEGNTAIFDRLSSSELGKPGDVTGGGGGPTPGEQQEAALQASRIQLGETVAEKYREIVREFEQYVNSIAEGRLAQDAVTKMIKDVQAGLEAFQYAEFGGDMATNRFYDYRDKEIKDKANTTRERTSWQSILGFLGYPADKLAEAARGYERIGEGWSPDPIFNDRNRSFTYKGQRFKINVSVIPESATAHTAVKRGK